MEELRIRLVQAVTEALVEAEVDAREALESMKNKEGRLAFIREDYLPVLEKLTGILKDLTC